MKKRTRKKIKHYTKIIEIFAIFGIVGFILQQEKIFWDNYRTLENNTNEQQYKEDSKEQIPQEHTIVENNLQKIKNEKNLTSNTFLETYSGELLTGETNIIQGKKTDEVLQQILLNSSDHIDTSDNDDIAFLHKAYSHTKDTQSMNNIVQLYIDQYQFVAAKNFINSLKDDPISKQLSWELKLLIEFNTFSLADDNAFAKLQLMLDSIRGTVPEETLLRYQSILFLMEKDYDHFFKIAQRYQNADHQNFRLKLEYVYDTIKKEQDMPLYYIDALFWVELFQQWFFQAAKIIALDVMSKNDKYILPYQILAYANFLTNAWSASISYLNILLEIDPALTEKYTMLLWIAYYRNKEYEKSVLQLSQIQNSKYLLDKERYLALNYLALWQKQKLTNSRERILGYRNLKPSDFYHYFYHTFFKSYQEDKKYEIYNENRKLADKYITLCYQTFKWEQVSLCKYGELGRNLAQGKKLYFGDELKSLVREYPQGYLYHLLWERYFQENDFEHAKYYLLKAIGMDTNEQEKKEIRTLLKDVLN